MSSVCFPALSYFTNIVKFAFRILIPLTLGVEWCMVPTDNTSRQVLSNFSKQPKEDLSWVVSKTGIFTSLLPLEIKEWSAAFHHYFMSQLAINHHWSTSCYLYIENMLKTEILNFQIKFYALEDSMFSWILTLHVLSPQIRRYIVSEPSRNQNELHCGSDPGQLESTLAQVSEEILGHSKRTFVNI